MRHEKKNIDNVNSRKETALLYASQWGHLEMVKYLVGNGADVNAKDKNDKTALILASENGHFDLVKYLKR